MRAILISLALFISAIAAAQVPSVTIENSKGESLKSLSQTTIKNTYFLLPKIEFQNKIANEFYELEKLKTKLQNIRSKIDMIL